MIKMERKYYYLNPGYIFYSEEPYLVETVLGSCISVCLWDKERKVGGVNHFVFAEGGKISEQNGKYGNYSMPYLIEIMLQHGSRIGNLSALIIGGANSRIIKMDVGERNLKTAKETLRKFGIRVGGEWIGGYTGRKVRFDTYTGNVEVIMLQDT